MCYALLSHSRHPGRPARVVCAMRCLWQVQRRRRCEPPTSTEMLVSASSLRSADVLRAAGSHGGIRTASVRRVCYEVLWQLLWQLLWSKRCTQMQWRGSGLDAGRSGIDSTDSDGS